MAGNPKKRRLEISFPELPEDDSSAKATWRNALHNDWKLVLRTRSFPVHKVIVGVGDRRSLFLAAAFRNPCGQQAEETNLTQLLPAACERVMEKVLDHMYGEEIELTADTWACVMKVADAMQIPSLSQRCVDDCDKLLATSPIQICRSASTHCLTDDVRSQLLQMASDVLASKFTVARTHIQSDLLSLVGAGEHEWSVNLLRDLLSRDDLAVTSEDDVFTFLQCVSSRVSPEVAAKLWAACRPNQLSPTKLLEALQEGWISKETLALAAVCTAPSAGMQICSPLSPRLVYGQTSLGTRVCSICLSVKFPPARKQGQSVNSDWRPFLDDYKFRLKVFPKGTLRRASHLGAFVEVKPLMQPVPPNWCTNPVDYSIIVINADRTKNVVRSETCTFAHDANGDSCGWHKLCSLSSLDSSGFLDGKQLLHVEASVQQLKAAQ